MTDGPSPTSTQPPGLEPALPEGVERDPRGRLISRTANGDVLIAAADPNGCLMVGVGNGNGRPALSAEDADRFVEMIRRVRTYGTYDPQSGERWVVKP